MRDGVLAVTPGRGIRLPRIAEHGPHVFSPERRRLASLVAVMRPPYGLFVLVLAYTGVRFGEVAGVRRRFVEPAGRRLMEHIEASVDWTGPEVLVFVNLHGLPVRHRPFSIGCGLPL